MSRASRGCLMCRQRRVKCDEGRPSCKRCIARNEPCEGYRDEGTLLFRSENEKAARKVTRRRSSIDSFSRPAPPASSRTSSTTPSFAPTPLGQRSSFYAGSVTVSSISSPSDGGVPLIEDPTDLSAGLAYSLDLHNPYPWAKHTPPMKKQSIEDQAVGQFFERYVMYPCNSGSSPGFLEFLPPLFKEAKSEGRVALRWAVRAASYASLSNEQDHPALGSKALECYGLALSALGEALADLKYVPNDYEFMTIVVLDIFEAVHLGDRGSTGAHAEGMAAILRLRGKDQVYGTRSWSLFRLSHHRLQRQQLAFKQLPLPESDIWLGSLNDTLPEVKIEKENHQISKICARARDLLQRIDETNLPLEEVVEMLKEINTLDQAATTWRHGPAWAFKTLHKSQLTQDEEILARWPEKVQLHRDVWIAYEWNYHRTARIIMHEHLLECLDRLHSICNGDQSELRPILCSFEETSIGIIKGLVDEILGTFPQSLGEIDFEGNFCVNLPGTKSCQGIGGYFLLWSIKVIKSTRSATGMQRAAGEEVFERIRECTGMKTVLGDASKI